MLPQVETDHIYQTLEKCEWYALLSTVNAIKGTPSVLWCVCVCVWAGVGVDARVALWVKRAGKIIAKASVGFSPSEERHQEFCVSLVGC